MNNYITGFDFVLIILYLFLIIGVGYLFAQRIKYNPIREYFIKGLSLKLICGLGFGWIYVYYYGGGDTQMYYDGAQLVYEEVTRNNNFRSLFSNSYLPYASDATRFTQRFAGAINLLAFNSYWSCTLLFAFLSFLGIWLLFISFVKQFPHLHKPLAIACLFVPGVAFWSAGIMKDSVCMLFVGVLVYGIQNIFIFNKHRLVNSVLVAISFYVLIKVKAYIALALIVAIVFYAILALKVKTTNKATRILLVPIVSVFLLVGALVFIRNIGESLQRYSLENIVETAQTYQGYHARTSIAGRGSAVRTGSGYTLGEINFNNPLSIAVKFPLAVNVTFFRPYLWEISNPVMALSALESTIILLFTLKVIQRAGLGRFIKSIFNKKEVLFCFTFALIFGFAVGFTTYNFGSLVRYKTPCIPFFLIGLVLINGSLPQKKNLKKAIRPVGAPGTSLQPLS